MLAAYQNPTDTMETKWESFQFSFIPSRILSAKKEGGGGYFGMRTKGVDLSLDHQKGR